MKVSWAMRPSVTMARILVISFSVALRKSRQVAISCGVGLFSGGTQRTALGMRQSMAVGRTRRVFARRKAEFLKGRVEEVAGVIAGKRPAGAVGAAKSRSKPDNQ